MSEWLPGMLPSDAGRLERAARRYAIAVLSRRPWRALLDDSFSRDGDPWVPMDGSPLARSWAVAYSDACCEADERQDPEGAIDHDVESAEPIRLLRARVALYLRWCERVERDEKRRRRKGYGEPWGTVNARSGLRRYADELDPEDVANGWRWAVPLWTLAPAHDPNVTPKMRRQR